MHLIVGIDTGKTSALACLDLNGRIVLLKTKRFAGMAWFVENMNLAGTPVVIAGDKKRANALIAKMAAIFDAALYTPREDISVNVKKEYRYEGKTANLHERDALTAAMTAYNAYANKLMQVEHLARERGVANVDGIKAAVIKKNSFHEAAEGKKTGRFVR